MGRNKPEIRIKRAYENKSPDDGYRVLVDRVWPRGRDRKALGLDSWARDLAPSNELRKWFSHDAARWDEFQQLYREELSSDARQEQMRQLLAAAKGHPITLVYGAKDTEHNQAVVLREALLRLPVNPAS
jgi:uncharacterized protein YeaO (DUF488 family)